MSPKVEIINHLKNHPLIKKLRMLDLPRNDFVLFGGAMMYVLGIKDEMHDLDIVSRNGAWKQAKNIGELTTALSGDERVEFFGGEIEVFNGWWGTTFPGEFNRDKLIDTAITIEGYKVVGLEEILRWKKLMTREKDKQDVKIITAYLENR